MYPPPRALCWLRGLYLIKDCATVRLASPYGRGAPAGGGEGPLSHGRCRASSPKGGAKYSLPNSPDVPEKGNAPLPGGRGRPPLRKVRPFVLLFKGMKFIPKGYHNCQLSIVNCQFSESILSLTNAPPNKNPGILLGYPVKHYSLPPWTYLRSQSRSKSLLPFSMLQPVYRS